MAYQQEPKAFQEAFAEIQAVMHKHDFNGVILLCQKHLSKESNYYFNRSMIVIHNETTLFTKGPTTPINTTVTLMNSDQISADPDGGLSRFKQSIRLLHGMIKAFETLDEHFKKILVRLGISEKEIDFIDPVKSPEQ